MNENVKDSGKTEEYSSGAHRDDAVGKGMCNLLPLEYVSMIMDDDPVIKAVAAFMETRNICYLVEALKSSIKTVPYFCYEKIREEMVKDNIEMRNLETKNDIATACFAHMMIEVSKLYEAGARKYGANNWQLGMPVNRYIDSGVRHYLKTLRGDIDEPHYRGFVWNLLCAMWTADHHPELNYKDEPKKSENKTVAE